MHVVADKPFAPSAQAGRELVRAAKEAGLALNVFHNRRWDADIRTLAGVLRRGEVGELWRMESRFDLDGPATLETGPHGGLLRDLGSHMVDQALCLLGRGCSVYAELDFVDLPEEAHRLRVHGADHARRRRPLAPQLHEAEPDPGAGVAGVRQRGLVRLTGDRCAGTGDLRRAAACRVGGAWGYESESLWGTLHDASGAIPVPSEQGAYQDYYTQFAAALNGGAEFPVPAAEAVHTLEVLDAARTSAEENRIVELPVASSGEDPVCSISQTDPLDPRRD